MIPIDPKTALPIIYVRGYAMTLSERDDTAADPFCGFNLGSTVLRRTTDRSQARKFIFESPVLRLENDYGYRTEVRDGRSLADEQWNGELKQRSIIILRYYDDGSSYFGDGKSRPITDYGKDLSDLIARIRMQIIMEDGVDFGVYLVAHSMGGLVCRAFLQNPSCDTANTHRYVRKFFTYATPHNGIELAGMNVPAFLSLNDTNNFNRDTMRSYLNLKQVNPAGASKGRADWIPEDRFPSRNICCLVGTNANDYTVAGGWSRRLAGPASDGLVRIGNAAVWGVNKAGTQISEPCATAYLHRSHSGHFGIVNSEEGFQNLSRFLFGNLRVDLYFDITDVRVPEELRAAEKRGKLDALYQIEIAIAPKGKPWYLTRRLLAEESAACVRHQDIRSSLKGRSRQHRLYLTSAFLSDFARVNADNSALNFRVMFAVRTPDYEVERTFFFDRHYEGSSLIKDEVTLSVTPGAKPNEWVVLYDWVSDNAGAASTELNVTPLKKKDGSFALTIPVDPGHSAEQATIVGQLRCQVSPWNT